MSTSHHGPHKRLPANPSIEHLKKQAKRKLRGLPEGSKLADVQHQLAREYGYKSWRELTQAAETLRRGRNDAGEITAAILREDLPALTRLLDEHPALLTPALWPPAIFQAKSLAVTRLLLERGLNPDECSAPRKPLHLAVDRALIEVIELLLAHGASPDVIDGENITPIELAAGAVSGARTPRAEESIALLRRAGARTTPFTQMLLAEDDEVIKALETDPAFLQTSGWQNFPPLSAAARAARPRVVEGLLAAGAEVNGSGANGNTPLWFACQSGANAEDRLSVAKILLEHGADPNHPCEDRSTPLHVAAWRGPQAMVRLLLDHGGDPVLSDSKGETPADYARESQVNPESGATLKLLGGAGFPSPVDIFLDTVTPRPDAHHKSGSSDPAMEMLEKHPDLPAAALAAACAAADELHVRAWLGRDATLTTKRSGPRGWSPLLYLCFSRLLRDRRKPEADFATCAKLLLEHGANANDFFPESAASPNRETVLYGAAGIANSPAVTRVLLDAGAFVTDPPDGETLYHVSEFADHTVLRMILEHRPKRSSVSYCMCHKMDMEDPEGLRLFIEHGADVNAEIGGGVFKGFRPLHFALFRNRSLTVLRILLDAGADPNLPATNGHTPLTLALRLGKREAVDLLTEGGAKPETDPTTQYLAALALGDAERAAQFRGQASVSEKDHHLLVDAAEAGNLPAVSLMLAEGFPIHTRGPSYAGWDGTALDHAAWRGSTKLVELLLRQGANPRLKHSFGGDALGAAIHGASHGNHHGGPATVAAIARHYTPEELEGYLKYAGTESNREVVKVLKKRLGFG